LGAKFKGFCFLLPKIFKGVFVFVLPKILKVLFFLPCQGIAPLEKLKENKWP